MFRKGKALLTDEDHKLRRQYLKAIQEKLPSEVPETPLTKTVEKKFPRWVKSLEKARLTRRKSGERYIQENDARVAKLIREAATRLKAQEGAPIWIRKNNLFRETGERGLCLRCQTGPLTRQALQECIQSKEDIVQARLTWAKNQSLEVLGKYEFLDKAKLRGMQGTKSIPGVITRQIRWKTLHEERQALITAWDEDAAKAVTRAAESIKSKPGRPEWIRLAGILRESGDMADYRICLGGSELHKKTRSWVSPR